MFEVLIQEDRMAAHHELPSSPQVAALLGRSPRRSVRLVHLHVMDSETHPDDHDETQTAAGSGSVPGESLELVLSLSELAARLQVSVQTLYDLRSQGRGPRGFRVGRELRFRLSEIDAWLARMEEADAERHQRGGSR